MADRHPKASRAIADADDGFEAGDELSPHEVAVRLAIADYVIRRVSGTAEGKKIFYALCPRFEGRYPHHKILSHCLIAPGYLEHESEDLDET